MNEKISRLIDRDMSADECDVTLGEIARCPLATRHWRNYHLIGNVLRGQVHSVGADLTARVCGQLQSEPEQMPRADAGDVARSGATPPMVWQSVGMLALAASLALVAVVLHSGKGLESADQWRMAQPTRDAMLFARELDQMLVEHGEFSPSPGLNGLTGFAKLISAESQTREAEK